MYDNENGTTTVVAEPAHDEPVIVQVPAAKIRKWATLQGMPVGKRGRIKPTILAAYYTAHPQ